MCSQLTEDKFNLHWKALLAVEPRENDWFSEINPKQSALACDEGKRFGIMTKNMAKSWNNAIKTSRKLLVVALVKALYYKVVSYFDQCCVEIQKQAVDGNEFTKHANKVMNKWKERATGHHVTKVDRNNWVFEVITMKRGQKGGKKQIVRLQERICTCNKWKTYHIPCSHVLACCASVGMRHTNFIMAATDLLVAPAAVAQLALGALDVADQLADAIVLVVFADSVAVILAHQYT
ncbi:hypothetical protein POM88_013929 [Heracleum sosnowskyi]|uniref:SWIM-type domain-containing protein n=1 Tax=Heracleum sosnowskyi TaxID=360622 RepID=A0AAD8J1J6_9APIA|nr:hypothetical protein POM88_013929 [Heracleum sosnowskyi]